MAAHHIGYLDINAAKRADAHQFRTIKGLVSTACHAASVAPLPDAPFPGACQQQNVPLARHMHRVHICIRAVLCHIPAAPCRKNPCAHDWHLPGFHTVGCAEVQGSDKASQIRTDLNKLVKDSMLRCFAWSQRDKGRYGLPVYFYDGNDVLIDTDRQVHYIDGEQLSPSVACLCLSSGLLTAAVCACPECLRACSVEGLHMA